MSDQRSNNDKQVRIEAPPDQPMSAREDLFKVLEAMSEGVLVWRKGQVLFANSAMMKLVRYSGDIEAAIGAPFEQWIHQDDLPLVRDTYRRRFEDEDGPEAYDFRLVRTDGESRWVHCRPSVVELSDGRAVIACIHDVTDARSSSQANERSEQMFRNVFRLSPEMMMMTSLRDDRLIDINPAFLNLFGCRREDVIGRTTAEINIWADPTFLSRFAEEFKMTASMTDVPTTVRTRGNIIRHFRLFAQKIDHGAEPVLLVIGRDVTEDLVQAQELQRSRDTAELANRAKSEFLANMSHELRTPLNAILGFAEILRDEMLGPMGQERYTEYAADIHKSGAHLLSIINDILDLSKVEAGRLEAHLSWVDPVPSMQMCLNLVQQRAQEAELTLIDRLTDGFEVEADERLVKQICLNLLSNALKFTEAGGTISLVLEKTADAGLCLSVEDSGIGMSPEEIKIAKRPFGQVDSSLSRRHQGSGLGLPLVAAFAEKLAGNMRIVSTPGVGTRVSVIFPPYKVRGRVSDEGDMI